MALLLQAAQQVAGADPLIESPIVAGLGCVPFLLLLGASSHPWAAQLHRWAAA